MVIMKTRFQKGFISHRSYDYDEALKLRDALISQRVCKEVVLWENESLCYNYEQLTVCEFFKAIDKIKKSMHGCDAFFIVDASNYENGYFTSAELLVWRYLNDRKECEVRRIKRAENEYMNQRIVLKPLSFREHHSLGFAFYYVNPDYSDMEAAATMDNWGKYGRNCYLVGCCKCGKYYLVSEKAMEWYTNTGNSAVCPNCQYAHASFKVIGKNKRLLTYRNPIVMQPLVQPCDLEHLGLFDLLWLMRTGKLKDSGFRLVAMEGEKFKSDVRKEVESTLKFTAGLWAVLGGGIYLLSKIK